MSKKTYDDVERQLTSLLGQKRAMEQRALKAFTDAVMRTDACKKLAKMSNADLQAMARMFVANLDGYSDQIEAGKQTKPEAKTDDSDPVVPTDFCNRGSADFAPDSPGQGGRSTGMETMGKPSKKLGPSPFGSDDFSM